MADRVLPIVELLFPIEDAVFDLEDGRWQLKHPLTIVQLPDGATFPFLINELSIYVRLKEGVGEMPVSVEMRLQEDFISDRLPPEGFPVKPVRSETISFDFPGGNQLVSYDFVMLMSDVPFLQSGIYEFTIMVNHAQLQGSTAILRVLKGDI